MKNSRIKRYARRLDAKRVFIPIGKDYQTAMINNVTLDEFEALRLIDLEGLSQIEASEDMQVSRATIQRLLNSGRKKITEALLYQRIIEVQNETHNIKLKGENKMSIDTKEFKVIAFPTSDRVTIDGHFGHTKEFAIYVLDGNKVKDLTFVTAPPHEPGLLPKFLGEQGIDAIVTGGMGKMAVDLFNRQNIDVILGARGRIEDSLREYVGGSLESTGSACSHNHGDHDGC